MITTVSSDECVTCRQREGEAYTLELDRGEEREDKVIEVALCGQCADDFLELEWIETPQEAD